MKADRPALVQYIADLNFLNIFLLIISLFPKLTKHLGIISPAPSLLNVFFRFLVILALIIISYGLLKLKQWGYWLMLGYNLFFLAVSIVSLSEHVSLSFYSPGFIISILGLSLTFSAKRYFMEVGK